MCATVQEKAFIQHAASLLGISVSELLRNVLLDAAQEIIRQHEKEIADDTTG